KEVENIKLSKTLYMADADKLLERIQKSGEKHPEVKIMLVVAHDPTVSILGARLGNIEDSDNDSLMQVSAGFSTAMGAIFTSDKPFKKWDNKEEKLVKIIRGEE
ncbi:MAG: hypothetical protein LBM13_06690, partial [Candidatus Ancillula sp.]|nr:hypothetical protein [Candidatus Ancillula sp.]